jgi:hypothetical protein
MTLLLLRSTGTSNVAPTATYTATLGPRDRSNPYFAELIAILTALQNLAALPIRNRVINILSSNLLAPQPINHSKQQSGQTYINQIYESAGKLRDMGNQIYAIWTPAHEEINIKAKAKAMAKRATARQATGLGKEVQGRIPTAKATVWGQAIAKRRQHRN